MKYIVKQGDSISSIARDQLGDINLWPLLAKVNNLSDIPNGFVAPYTIYPGQVLELSIPVTSSIPNSQVVKPVLVQAEPKSFLGIGIGGLLFVAAVIGFIVYNNKKNKKS